MKTLLFIPFLFMCSMVIAQCLEFRVQESYGNDVFDAKWNGIDICENEEKINIGSKTVYILSSDKNSYGDFVFSIKEAIGYGWPEVGYVKVASKMDVIEVKFLAAKVRYSVESPSQKAEREEKNQEFERKERNKKLAIDKTLYSSIDNALNAKNLKLSKSLIGKLNSPNSYPRYTKYIEMIKNDQLYSDSKKYNLILLKINDGDFTNARKEIQDLYYPDRFPCSTSDLQKKEDEFLKNQIINLVSQKRFIEAGTIYESKSLNDKMLFDVIQNQILRISLDKEPDDLETFNLLVSKLTENKFLNLSQGIYILESDTITGLTLTDNNSGQKFQLEDKVIIEKKEGFDRINQFVKKIEIKKTITLHGVKLNPRWDGLLDNGSLTMRFFKANKKGKTIILGGVKDTPPSKYTNIEIVPGLLNNISFEAELGLKKGRFIFLNKIYFNGVEKFNKLVVEEEILDLIWFYF